MQERHARLLALGIGAVVTAAALAFGAYDGAPRDERPPPATAVVASASTAPATETAPPVETPPTADATTLARGAELFVALDCVRCHSYRGVGRPSGALDDAASRGDAREMARWITADPAIADQLSAKARTAKARYAALPPADLTALIEYLNAPASE